ERSLERGSEDETAKTAHGIGHGTNWHPTNSGKTLYSSTSCKTFDSTTESGNANNENPWKIIDRSIASLGRALFDEHHAIDGNKRCGSPQSFAGRHRQESRARFAIGENRTRW